MGIYSIWPYFVCMGALLVFAAAPAFRAADTPPSPGRDRISTLDGLRGFLALGVFFHHAAINHEYMIDGRFYLPPSRFYTMLGQVSVAMFFMITGYLFWSRMIRSRGRPDWLRLYTGRVFRIGPLYTFAAVAMLMVVFSHTGLKLNVAPLELIKEITKWLMLGYFGEGPDINGYTGTSELLVVAWTLRPEWIFYVSLLITSLAARDAKTHLPFTAVGWIASLTGLTAWDAAWIAYVALFFTGMLCASLEENKLTLKVTNRTASILILALIGGVFTAFPSAYQASPIILIGLAFFLIVSGYDVFGLLLSHAACRLGNISYGIYLLHLLVLTLVFSIDPVRAFALGSPSHHWVMVLMCGALIIVAALVAHVCIERPGIKLGNRFSVTVTTYKKSFTAVLMVIALSLASTAGVHW